MNHKHSQDSLDEDRILNEIKGLQKQLSWKSGREQDRLAMSKAQQKFNSFAKYPQLQQEDHIFLQQINNIQYFSQINNKETEDDSLFEHQMKLFGHPHTNNSTKASNKSIAQSRQDKNEISRSKASSNKQNQNEQILKEQNYIFRKEKDNKSKTTKLIQPKPKINNNPTPKQAINNNKVQLKENHNINIYFQQQNQLQHHNANHNKHARMKTQQPYYQTNIDAYLEQIANQQMPKIQEQSKSKSRIKLKADQHSLECTFKPKILKKSKEMVKSTKNVIERLSVNNNSKTSKAPYQPTKANTQKPKMQRIEQLSQPRRQKPIDTQQEQQMPSFKPHLSKKSLQHMSNCTYDVATRNKLWLQQKQEKIKMMRKEDEEQRMRKEECTHSPAIKVYRGEQDVQFSKFGKQGMVQYFQRLSMMKKKASFSNLKKDETMMKDTDDSYITDKQKINLNISRQKSFSNLYKAKKQTYEQAVKNLHTKIMKLKI